MVIASGLLGAYPLTRESIQSVVPPRCIGAYALGRAVDGGFLIDRVGRSDTDVQDRMFDYVGKYHAFMYVLLPSKLDAFNKECWLFHTFKPRDNIYHPDQPDGMDVVCLHCPIYNYTGNGVSVLMNLRP